MTGYSLDGVLVSKLTFASNISFVKKQQRDLPNPVFVPGGDYIIITGRPADEESETSYWVENKLIDNPPKRIYHGNLDIDDPSKYKAQVINENGVNLFVGADKVECEYLKTHCPRCSVIHFSDFVRTIFSNM